jgi:hypothetical protein
MIAVGGTPQAVESARMIIVLFAIVFVVFWKPLLKIAVMVAATTMIVLLTSGAVVLLQDIHHLSG